VILSAASQREDRCLIAPKNLKGGAAQKVAAKLLEGGLAREIKARAGMAIWRRDEEAGQDYSLKLTAAGLKAIAVDEGDSQTDASSGASANASEGSSKAKKVEDVTAKTSAATAPISSAPRRGTKIAHVIELLQRDQGAKLDELIAATGWLPHTARAALTGLRHRGYEVRLERGEKGRASVYRAFAALAMAS
jgi:Protein of unknown function (DUF3489)